MSKYCSKCGAEVNKKDKVCFNCNAPLINYEKYATEGLVFGIFSVFCWIIPLFGLITSIGGIINSRKAIGFPECKTKATIGLVLSIIFLILTIINIVLS